MRAVWGLAWILLLLSGCEPSTDRSDPAAVRVVHVAWPGRPLSDEMERRTFADPLVIACLARIEFVATTVDEADAGVRDVLRGMGTVVFDGAGPVAVHAGAMPPRSFVEFVRRARDVAAELRGLRADPGPAAALQRARLHAELGLPERALDALAVDGVDGEAATSVAVDARLALGDVAGARRVLDGARVVRDRAIVEGRLLVAERNPRAAIRVLRVPDAPDPDGARAFWLGRALLDVEERPEAFALLEPLARGEGRWARAARDLLSSSITGGHGHR